MLHEAFEGLTFAEASILLGLATTITSGLVVVIRRGWPMLRKIVALVNAIAGEAEEDVPPGAERRLGILDRMAVNEGKLAQVIQTQADTLEAMQRTARHAEGAQTAAEIAARQAADSANLTRQVSELAAQAADSAKHAADDAAEARRIAEGVAKELQNNGGSTLRDAVDRVEKRLTEHLDAVRHEATPESPAP